MSNPSVAFVGMTHLGLNSAAAAATRGFKTLGFDPDARLTQSLSRSETSINEPGLVELLRANMERLAFSSAWADLSKYDVVYISVDVPTDDTGKSDLSPIEALIAEASRHLAETAVLVVLCQVPPGFTRALRSVPSARLIYQVETLVFGQAVERAMHPERFIVGVAESDASLPPAYEAFLSGFGCPILKMSYESAELAKISINMCLVASVTVANTLAELSERIGADWLEIVPALKLDKRIGPYAYLAPGLGISGGNLERDLRTIVELGDRHHSDVGMVRASIDNSQRRKEWLWKTLFDEVLRDRPEARVGVLGLSYKEDTHSTKNSPSLRLLAHLEGRDVRVHDPVVPASVVPFAVGCPTPLDCATGCDVLVIATAWPMYRSLDLDALAGVMRGRVLLDPYRLLPAREVRAKGFDWFTLGRKASRSA